MKNKVRIVQGMLIVFLFLFSFQALQAQEWKRFLPENKVKNHTLTLKDYQKAFSQYWQGEKMKETEAEKEVEDEIKDENYEKFKRWEWYWETRVDPKTKAFPKTTAWDIYQRYLKHREKSALVYDNGNWINIGPNQTPGGYAGLGRVNCVAFSPVDTTTLYIGAASGGVWKTTDLGKTWTPLGDFNMALGVADIVVENEGGQDIVYLGTGDKDHWDTYSVGVLKSTDGGKTWQKTGLTWKYTDYAMVYRILKDPDDDNTLYVSTNKGLYKTTDAGATFQRIDAHHFREIEFNPDNKNIMYAGDSWGGIFYSTDGGSSWTQVVDKSQNSGGRVAIAVSADSANVVYGLIANSDNNGLFGVYRSNDYGHNFSVVQDTINLLGWNCSGTDDGGQGWYDLVLVADPKDANTVYVGGVNTWVSHDGGHHWKIANHWSSTCANQNEIVHADKHYMAFQPATNALFECNDGGIYKTNDGKHWTDLTNGLAISQIYRLNTSATVSGEIITGLQDNGTKLLSSGLWTDVMGGDGMDCQIDYTDVNTQYGESPNGQISRTTDHWDHSKDITTGLSGDGAWVTPFLLDPKDHKTIYIGYQDVFKSTDQGNTWTKISSWDGKTLRSLAVAPSNTKVIYAATYSIIYRTDDGGDTWQNITSNLPVDRAAIKYITIKNDDPNTVWVAMGGYNDMGVYKTINGGESWENISTGLPEVPVNCIVQNTAKKDTVELYAGTDVGVFVQQNLSRWIPFNQNLPNVIVNDLDISKDGKLFAATFGRGLWTSPLFTGYIEPIKQALFEADNLKPYVGDTVRFTDLSTNHPTSWKWHFSPSTVTYLSQTDSTSQNPVVKFNEAGSYSVTLSATGDDSTYTRTENDYVNVKSLLSLTVKANRTTVCSGDTTQLFAIMSGGSGNYSFNWSSDPIGFMSYEQDPVVKPFKDSVLYIVQVYDGNISVKGSIKIYREECTGIQDNVALLGKIRLFPNPNTGSFVIKTEKEFYRVDIYNHAGVKVYSHIFNSKEAEIHHHFARGAYVVKISVGSASAIEGVVTKRIIVK